MSVSQTTPTHTLISSGPIQPLNAAPEASGLQTQQVLEIALVTLRRHFKWLVPAAILAMTLGGLGIRWQSEPTFRATHWVEVSQHRVLAPGAAKRLTNLVSSETPIILSEIIIDPVLARPELQALPSFNILSERERLIRENLTLKGGGTPGRLSIAFTDTDAESTSVVCNAVADEYME